jgi:hypothetical protein
MSGCVSTFEQLVEIRFSSSTFQVLIPNHPGNDVLAHRLCPVDISRYFGIIADGMQNKGKLEELQLQLRAMFAKRQVL